MNPSDADHPGTASPAVHKVSAQAIHDRLLAALQPVALEVQDDSHLHAGHEGARQGRHFGVLVCSERFEGLGRVARHRLVYDALGPLMTAGIHALAIDARAPSERKR